MVLSALSLVITHHISFESAAEAVRKYTEQALDLSHSRAQA